MRTHYLVRRYIATLDARKRARTALTLLVRCELTQRRMYNATHGLSGEAVFRSC